MSLLLLVGLVMAGVPFLLIVGFAGFKHHIGFYPMTSSFLKLFKKELASYKTSKGAIQFPLDKPLPATLIKKLIKARIKEINK